MYLVDSSVWIDHFRKTDPLLVDALEGDLVACHDHVIGELALGSIKDRDKVLHSLSRLPRISAARDSDVLEMINQHKLFARGIGYIDAHLLAASLIDGQAKVWTHDKRFKTISQELGISAQIVH